MVEPDRRFDNELDQIMWQTTAAQRHGGAWDDGALAPHRSPRRAPLRYQLPEGDSHRSRQ